MASVEVDSHRDIPQFRQARSMNQKLARGLGANTHIVSSASMISVFPQGGRPSSVMRG